MCDTLLLVSYEYKDNNRDSLKIKSINIKKEHSIDRKDHNKIYYNNIYILFNYYLWASYISLVYLSPKIGW